MMIRVLLFDPAYRDSLAAFLRYANLIVSYPEGAGDELLIDFRAFDFDEQVQLRIAQRMIAAWDEKHDSIALTGAHARID